MLDLNTIFGMREQMMPQNGFLGFLLKNWLIIAIVLMVLGFVIDQVLYIVRYRPQDKCVRAFKTLYGFLTGKKESEDYAEEAEADIVQADVPQEDPDAPVIRRGGAQFTPNMRRAAEPERTRAVSEMDADAPVIVRAAASKRNADPDTYR